MKSSGALFLKELPEYFQKFESLVKIKVSHVLKALDKSSLTYYRRSKY